MSILLNPILNDKFYNSDIESKINKIELQQANQNFNKPQYLIQFDDLRFDNIAEPTSINDIYETNSGKSSVFEDNIYFENGYSKFNNNPQSSNLTYNIVGENDFTHNNMIPSTSKRDFPINTRRCESKLETFTGNFTNYTPKTEKVPLFAPVSNLTHVNGVPTITSKLQNRYLPSNKNNLGNLPFENKVRVKPGLDGKVQEGKYSVYRVNPKTVDELRSDINKKVSYNNKPLETKKLGEMRAPDFNLTKYKLPDFKIKEFSDLLPTKSEFEAPKQTGTFTNVISQRGEEEKYLPGPAINTTKGDAPNANTRLYETAKKQSFLNDPTHAFYEVSNKPVMTNTKSYENNVTNRATTNTNYNGSMNGQLNAGSSYTIDYNNVAKDTVKQSLINGNTITSATGLSTPGYVSKTDTAKKTIREDFNYNVVLNTTSIDKQPAVYNNDIAKKTIRQDTTETKNIGSVSNSITESSYVRDINNVAKNTHRQETEHTQYIGSVNNPTVESIYARDVNETARKTIRQDTGITKNIGTIKSSNIDSSYIRDFNNVAKDTIKQTTLLNDYKGVVKNSIEAPPSHQAANNMHLNECRETVSMFNRTPNGKADLHGPTINKENVVLVEPILYSYTPNPVLKLDNLTPRVPEEMIRNVYAKAKPVFESSSYFITNNRINTLNNNPLVNDIYHQKNF